MRISKLTVVLVSDKTRRIKAFAEQMTPEGLKRGTNILRAKRPKDFKEARTLVEAALGHSIGTIEWKEESGSWED